mmetsp:Transcript_7105/g.27231  ORF Transcript_7105/g.27231 Transcript_7105/m.27231 type:complete len:321 (+) Transcript_7105:1055-2017(+)
MANGRYCSYRESRIFESKSSVTVCFAPGWFNGSSRTKTPCTSFNASFSASLLILLASAADKTLTLTPASCSRTWTAAEILPFPMSTADFKERSSTPSRPSVELFESAAVTPVSAWRRRASCCSTLATAKSPGAAPALGLSAESRVAESYFCSQSALIMLELRLKSSRRRSSLASIAAPMASMVLSISSLRSLAFLSYSCLRELRTVSRSSRNFWNFSSPFFFCSCANSSLLIPFRSASKASWICASSMSSPLGSFFCISVGLFRSLPCFAKAGSVQNGVARGLNPTRSAKISEETRILPSEGSLARGCWAKAPQQRRPLS